MITISIIDGQVFYGIDYSEKGAEIFHITMEEFTKIQNGLATFTEGKVVDLPPVEIPGPTQEELDAVRDATLVDITIPKAVRTSATYKTMVKDVIIGLREDYSEIKNRWTEDDESMRVYNIVFKDIAKFITPEAYAGYKQLGITFHELIEEHFNPKPVAKVTAKDPKETETEKENYRQEASVYVAIINVTTKGKSKVYTLITDTSNGVEYDPERGDEGFATLEEAQARYDVLTAK